MKLLLTFPVALAIILAPALIDKHVSTIDTMTPLVCLCESFFNLLK